MKFPILLTATALALGTAVYASPVLRLPALMQESAGGTAQGFTETSQGYAEQSEGVTGWLHFVSGDNDDGDDGDDGDDDDDEDCEDDDRDDDDCDQSNPTENGVAPPLPGTPPQNGLFSSGKAPTANTN